MCQQSHILGSYNDQDHSWGSQNFQTISTSYKALKHTFLVELENGHYVSPLTLSVLQIPLFFTCSNMGALICNYLPDEASGVHEFSTLNRQDGHLQIDPKRNNLRSYAHGQLRLEQAKLAIA
jgi:hypothetical protein